MNYKLAVAFVRRALVWRRGEAERFEAATDFGGTPKTAVGTTALPKTTAMFRVGAVVLAVIVLAGRGLAQDFQAALDGLRQVRERFAPDAKMAIFEVSARQDSNGVVLQGDVTSAAAKEAAVGAIKTMGFSVVDNIKMLPEAELGDRVGGIVTKSVADMRVRPFAEYARAMATQAFMGSVLRVWKRQTNASAAWFLVQTADDYVSWTDGGSFVACTKQQAETWQAGPLLIVTALEGRILTEPATNGALVSDVVQCDLVKYTGTNENWFRVELPDGRAGYLARAAAADWAKWRSERRLTAENIERTAKVFLGQPYVWGGISWRGMDCSGFTRVVYFWNGADDLHRDAYEQCRQGVEVAVDRDFKNLKKGDLLFFGRAARGGSPERITHVAIYLEDKLFIQDEGDVHISSLDPDSPLTDWRHIISLLHVRRLLAGP